jgi:hypothetical protein
MSKYKATKCLVEFKYCSKKEIETILKNRQYVENNTYWSKGFVKVIILNDVLLIQHDIKKNDKGIKYFFEKEGFIEILKYFEYKMV